MAYADQPMSKGKLTSIIIVVLLHAALGYAFITGLAYNVIKQVPTVLDTFNVEQAKPPEQKPPPPPPPEKELPPPPVAPPPVVQVQTMAPPVQIQTTPNPAPAPPPVITPPAPPAAPAQAKGAQLRGNRGTLITNDDYPPTAQRAGEEGVAGAAWEVTADGRVENCHITSTSGSPTLDQTTCQLITRRFKYKPAVDANGQPMRVNDSQRIVWRIPKD